MRQVGCDDRTLPVNEDSTDSPNDNQPTGKKPFSSKSIPSKRRFSRQHRDDATYVSEIIPVNSILNIRANFLRQPRTTEWLENRIIINVCGDRYETHRSTLELYPNTLLGNHQRRKYYYDPFRKEYFFDRNRSCFEAILYYYQSHGRLRRPSYVPIDIFLEEVTFFELGSEALNQLRTDENIEEVRKVRLPKNRFRRHLWATMEYPDYSLVAKLVNIFSLLLILLSSIALAVESLPNYSRLTDLECQKNDDSISFNQTNEKNSTDIYICHFYFSSPFFIIQAVCMGYFTLELLLRVISTPSLLDFMKNIMNCIDILAVIPFYIILAIRLTGRESQIDLSTYISLRLLRLVRFLRIFKLYQILKGIKSLRVLASTLKQSIPDFFIMIFILTLLSFIFGAAIYLAESDANGQIFDSIFIATYWGVITITSVGYGDIAPITPVGRVISCLCALCGAATIAVLVSVLVDRYQHVYARKLYIQEEIIDFHDYSDDENQHETESKDSTQLHRREECIKIEDPDRRAKDQNQSLKTTDTQIETNHVTDSQKENTIHFIIGYVNDENRTLSRTLLRRIGSAIAGENIQLATLDTNEAISSLHSHVKFRISSSSDEDSEEELTEIVHGSKSKGNVLKTFARSTPSFHSNKSTEEF